MSMRLDLGWAVVRFTCGLIMAYYGSQKALGLFGGNGIEGTINGFQQGLGIPPALAMLAIAGEFLGGLGLMSGLLTRVAGFGVFVTMMVAMSVNVKNGGGLGMLATGDPADAISKVFFTFVLAMIGLAAVIHGGGRYSLDEMWGLDLKLFKWMRPKTAVGAND
jgi:putative oxidoreductase